ncbi:MAG: hypothetical protein R3B90_23530 [Planctomycetaceae bacterium]
MSDVLRLPPSGSFVGEVRKVVAALAEGGFVVLPGECGYLLACAPLDAGSTEEFLADETSAPTLLLSHPDAACDYVGHSQWSGPASRLSRRCWPGPVLLRFSGPAGDA